MPGPATYNPDYPVGDARDPSDSPPSTVQTQDVDETPGLVDGDRFAKSPLTDTYYRVSEWEDLGDGYIRATEKTPIAREDVPEDWLEVLDQ